MCIYKRERERKKPQRKCPLHARNERHPKPPPPRDKVGSLSSLFYRTRCQHQTAFFQSVFPHNNTFQSLRRDDDEEADDDSQTLLLFFFFFSRRCHLRFVPFPLFFFVYSCRRRGKGSNDNNVNIITTALEFQMHRPWVRPERGALRLLPLRTERRAGRKRQPKPVRERVLGVLQRERRG